MLSDSLSFGKDHFFLVEKLKKNGQHNPQTNLKNNPNNTFFKNHNLNPQNSTTLWPQLPNGNNNLAPSQHNKIRFLKQPNSSLKPHTHTGC